MTGRKRIYQIWRDHYEVELWQITSEHWYNDTDADDIDLATGLAWENTREWIADNYSQWQARIEDCPECGSDIVDGKCSNKARHQ